MVELIGHRGACGHAPENTLASLHMARTFRLRWVEFDVHSTADDVPVLLHDHTLDRTTDSAGPISERSLRGLSGVDAGSWFGDRFRGAAVPTLEQAMRLLAVDDMRANAEIKPSPGRDTTTAETAVRVLLRSGIGGDRSLPLISSFSTTCLAVARKTAPALPRALLFEEVPDDWLDHLRALECEGLHCHHLAASPELVHAVKAAGFAIRVYTVNDAARASELAGFGVDAIVTDYPDRLLPALRSRARH